MTEDQVAETNFLYVCHFDNGHVKVGRSISPKTRIYEHASRVSCIGLELRDYHIVECENSVVSKESMLINLCAESATTRNKNEWFVGLDYKAVCNWANECAINSLEGNEIQELNKLTNGQVETKKAIKLAGSAVELARILGVTRQAVTNWVDVLPGLRVYQLKEKKPEWFEVKK